jgi:hypothetical protein
MRYYIFIQGESMKLKVVSLLFLGFIICSSSTICAKEKKKEHMKSEQEVKLEQLEVISDYKFEQEDIQIYNYIRDIILHNSPFRVEVEMGTDGNYVQKKIPTSTIVIDENTTINLNKYKTYDDNTQSDKAFIVSKKGESYNEAIDDFIQNNKKVYDITSYINADKTFISYKTIENQVNDPTDTLHYWNRFYIASPNSCGCLALSRIGYNNNHSIAVIQVSFMWGGMSGYVDYVFFEKQNSKWSAVDSLRIVYY